MVETWDMSFLVDRSTQIQEARGNLARHFGMLQQVLAGKHLINFIAEPDRLAFLRMMGRLSQRSWHDTVSVRFQAPVSGERKLALQARPGPHPTAWWLMLSESGAESVPAIDTFDMGERLANEDEFATLAAGLGANNQEALEISVFRAAILAENQANRALPPETHAELHEKIGTTLQEHATGAVSNPEPGHYTLLHEKEKPAHHIAEHVAATAATVGVSSAALGLSHRSAPLAADTSADAVRDLVRNMRQNLGSRTLGTGSRKHGLMDTLKSLVGRG
ncbi:MAG TPA: PAS domain-containing protein [Candidatus Cybelea sp.]|nr:PAS domain-containing protein [Candidatus Cybelea sp.]